MTAQRTLRSNTSLNHCTAAVSRFPHGDHSSEENSLAEGPTAATAIRTLAKKKEKRLHKSKENPVSPLAKRARIETPKLQQKALSKYSQDGSQMPTHLPNSEVELSSNRPAEPHRTNAPQTTPKGSRLVTYNKETADASPSKTGLPRPTTTTSHILDEACAHLVKMEPKLQPLIEKHYCRVFCPEGLAEECDPFRSLCSSIMAQQVSGAAASSIKRKFVELFSGPFDEEKVEEAVAFPTPTQVAACDVAFLRQAGLSQRKAEYIKGLADKFASGALSAAMLINASDEEVLEKLTAVRGLGKWSVEMFACFGLKRMDIISTGDLGVRTCLSAVIFHVWY
ncbi:MAG: 3-methyladenine DNA glycosylase [Alectoria fallacina]|uniref:3-methyladenine DNA glycosylase n=1 Tax=Alectoria fallacina TaxID=1903189 RepID=A0A8H3IFQ6_9LECA|nr:MAG: 3-methyladenine DNA glycosylase [Alectoria fallacina]